MINSKQRAYLRGLANREPALYQVGKDGINDNICLLYTSPSPRDRQKSRMPSSA